MKYVIIDFEPVMAGYLKSPSLRKLFYLIPIKSIVEAILSVSHYVDYSDMLFDTLDELLGHTDVDVDLDMLEIITDALVEEIDACVLKKIMVEDRNFYLIEQWVDETSALLEIL